MTTNEPVSIRILDREFLIACVAEEREGLLEAARHLDERMRALRSSMSPASLDRIAIMAALNISHELLAERARTARLGGEIGTLATRLEHVLAASLQ